MSILHRLDTAPRGTPLTRQYGQGRPALRVAADTAVSGVVDAQPVAGGDAGCPITAGALTAHENIGIPAPARGGGIL